MRLFVAQEIIIGSNLARMTYRNHLNSSTDLITPHSVTAQVFINMALERNRRATIYVKEGKTLKIQANNLPDPTTLIEEKALQGAILTTAGVSDKAKEYFQEVDRQQAIREFVESFLEPAGIDFPDELVSRYLLTRGDIAKAL